MLGGPGQKAGSSWPWPAPPGKLQSLCTQWKATDYIGAPANHSTSDRLKGWTQWAPEPCWRKSCFVEWAPTQLSLQSSQRLVVSGHSQSLQLTCWGVKSFLLTCQQKSRLSYKRRVYTANMVGSVPVVHSLGDCGGCATAPYRIPSTLSHSTKPVDITALPII